MQRRLTAQLLVYVTLLAYLLPGIQTGTWYCEGQECGVTPWYCCCNAPTNAGDPNCRDIVPPHDISTSKPEGAFVCQAGCNCTMVVSDNNLYSRLSTPIAYSSEFVATLPLLPATVLIPTTETKLSSVEARGPPVSSRLLLPLGLRAPPTSGVPMRII